MKTNAFETLGSIPSGATAEPMLQGTVVNSIGGIYYKQANMSRGRFPRNNFDKILVLEAGRKPVSTMRSILMMVAGVLVSFVGVLSFFVGRDD